MAFFETIEKEASNDLFQQILYFRDISSIRGR